MPIEQQQQHVEGDMMVDHDISSDDKQQQQQQQQEELPISNERMERPLALGEQWFVVSEQWMKQWEQHVRFDDDDDDGGGGGGSGKGVEKEAALVGQLGPVDNSELLELESENDRPKLKKYVQEYVDYRLVPEDVWEQLKQKYGGGPEVQREVIDTNGRGFLGIDLFPYFLRVAHYSGSYDTALMEDDHDDGDDGDLDEVDDSSDEEFQEVDKIKLKFREIAISGKATLEQLLEQLKDVFELNVYSVKDDLRLWKCYRSNPYEIVKDVSDSDDYDDVTVEYLFPNAQIGCELVVESKNSNGSWPLGHDEKSTKKTQQKRSIGTGFRSLYNNTGLSSSFGTTSYLSDGNGRSSSPGVCGLGNLGNTCFMNSGLQCLTKTPALRQYFTSDKYLTELNRENPLGMGGKIALAFGNLMKNMWSGQHSSVTPRDFKQTIGRFAPQFSGYQQQDSQELIAYLLDGLHEDLNRIKDKPLTPQVESNGRPDQIVADEAWRIHKKRNDSIIVDLFQGQLKSTLVCPQKSCVNSSSVSITFDPFMYLSLPLPTEKMMTVPVTFYAQSGNIKPIKMMATINKHGTCRELREAVCQMVSADGVLNPNDIVLADIFNHGVYKYLSDRNAVDYIRDNDVIVAYEVPGLEDGSHILYGSSSSYSSSIAADDAKRPFTHAKLETTSDNAYSRYNKDILEPFIFKLERGVTTASEVYNRALEHVKRYIDPMKLEEKDLDTERALHQFVPKSAMNDANENGGIADNDDSMRDAEDESVDNEPLITLQCGGKLIPYSDDIVEPHSKDDESEHNFSSSYHMRSRKRDYTLWISPMLINALNIEQGNAVPFMHESLRAVSEGENDVSLDDCLNLFTSEEKLSEEDSWYCPRCKEFVQATKKFDIWSLPEILVIHLKRFQYTSYSRDKLNTFVNFPIAELDMAPHVPKESIPHQSHLKYELFAVSNHMGGLGGGHYTAYAKINDSGKWYSFDDSYTREANENSVRSSSAYLLFYRAKDASA